MTPEFRAHLKGKLAPLLRGAGFSGSGVTFRRQTGDVIQVLHVQGSQHGGSCCVNLASTSRFFRPCWATRPIRRRLRSLFANSAGGSYQTVKPTTGSVACGLAQAELVAGNTATARALVAEIAARRHDLSPELVAVFAHLETEIPTGDDDPSAPATDTVSRVPAAKSDEESSSAGRRLISALLMGSLTFAATLVVIYVPVLLSRASTPAQLFELLVVALIAGVVFGMGLLLVHAPVLGLMRAWLGDRLTNPRRNTRCGARCGSDCHLSRCCP